MNEEVVTFKPNSFPIPDDLEEERESISKIATTVWNWLGKLQLNQSDIDDDFEGVSWGLDTPSVHITIFLRIVELESGDTWCIDLNQKQKRKLLRKFSDDGTGNKVRKVIDEVLKTELKSESIKWWTSSEFMRALA